MKMDCAKKIGECVPLVADVSVVAEITVSYDAHVNGTFDVQRGELLLLVYHDCEGFDLVNDVALVRWHDELL